ncbi:FAS1 domain-containing protein [Chaetomium strumarium]|uniref:FAS1 domain-containing protein n=1 Tax=Chaetomium strumarium TaxID=1170767 RepID=A0AAJ0M1N0_9PEZI|nr:FAS1 domain-containing protein [Chaetomium strumarium]
MVRRLSAGHLLATAISLIIPTQAVSLEATLADQANLTAFRGLVKNHTHVFADLPEGVTVVAPTDNAFGKVGDWGTYNASVVEATLKYHILKQAIAMPSIAKGDSIWASTILTDQGFANVTNGQRLLLTKQPGGEVVLTSGFATRGTVVVEDVAFDHGLVQIIDSVMRIPESLPSTARSAYTDLTAFVGALYATDLMRELLNEKDVTIFAPHNAAFQQLAGTLAAMDREKLRRVLRYHIVPGRVAHLWELRNGSALATADSGNRATVTRSNFVYVNSARVIQSDILIANGVVHMVEGVLNPDKADARPDETLTTAQPPVFPSLVGPTATGSTVPTPFASALPCTASCATTRPSAAATGAGEQGASSKNAGVSARCTGLVGAGVGVGLMVGGLMLGL